MNYITLINQFWQLRREVPFSSVEADLYFYLLEISNSLQWKNPFQQSNALIGATLGVSEKTLISARNRLKQHGLIDFTPGVKRTPSTYRLLMLKSKQGNTLSNTLENLQGIREECDSVSGENTPDIIKHKLNQTKGKTATAVKGAGKQAAAALARQEGVPETAPPGNKTKPARAAPSKVVPLADCYGEQVAALSESDRLVWERFVAWEQDNPLPKIFRMLEPLTPSQLVALDHRYGAPLVTSVLMDMQNRPKLLTEYESANLTARSWLRRRQP